MENCTPSGINGTEDCSHILDQDKDMEEVIVQITQLQAMTSELKTGLMSVIQDLSTLKMKDSSLEDRMVAYHNDMDEKTLVIKTSLSTFKEDLSSALCQIKEINGRQKEMQQHLELFQADVARDHHSAQTRRGSKENVLADSTLAEGWKCPHSHSELSILQHYFSSLANGSPQRSVTSVTSGTASPEREADCLRPPASASKSPVWSERRDSTDAQATHRNGEGNRQTAALELLESERVYVSYLSLLLKANITFNGSEGIHVKDKRPFPSSLRFLIQQHLELLHILQERVLKHQWQGIVGDVFMRLTSKESDFLDYYVAYLKELPECLTAVNMYSTTSLKAAGFFEADVMGDETRPPLHTLLLHPVQRIPEYLLLLQNLLKQTDVEHPDYYLVLVCIQQFRAFISQYSHLLQHNEDLLLKSRKELKRSAIKHFLKTVDRGIQAEEQGSPSNALMQHSSQVKRSKQKLLEQMQSKRYLDWEAESQSYDSPNRASQAPFFTPEADPRLKSSGLQSIPETDQEKPTVELPPCRHLPQSTSLAEPTGQFLVLSGAPSLEGLYEDRDLYHNTSLFDNCSSASTDSSIDIAFVHHPKSHSHEQNSGDRNREGRYQYPGRGCVSPDEAGSKRHRPLQVVQRKSKSLNGLQLDSSVVANKGAADQSSVRDYGLPSSPQHARLEPQSSKGLTNRKMQRTVSSPLKTDADKRAATQEELCKDHDEEPTGQSPWPDESRWRVSMEENVQLVFSERSRKQDQKGGFRSSFKKLFKKKSGSDSKEKAVEKSEIQTYSDHECVKTPQTTHLGDANRATAV